MIGIAKLQSGSSNYEYEYELTVSPGFIGISSAPGTTTSPVVYSEVTNGVGPYEYAWEITGSDISIVAPSSSSTSFTASGGNVIYIEVAKEKTTK